MRSGPYSESQTVQFIGIDFIPMNGSKIADTFDPTRTGMISCISLDRGERDSRSVVFLEGEKYSWVFCARGYTGKGLIANGGLDRLKEEIAKLLE